MPDLRGNVRRAEDHSAAHALIRRRAAIGGACLLLATPARAACRLEQAAEAPVRNVEGFPIVGASIGGRPVSMVLDTGAQGHLLTPAAQAALGIATLPGLTTKLLGTGGARDVALVMLDGLRLGAATLPALPTPVAPLPAGVPTTTPLLAGLLGAPLLAAYDLDLDVPAGRLSLYEPGACGPAVPAIGARVTALPLIVTPDSQALLAVRVNGQALVALLDTGSRATVLTQDAARRLGLRAPISANTATGVDGERLPVEHVRVRALAVGEDVRRDVPVSIARLQLGRADLALGLDYLGQRRVWISYATGLLAIALPRPAASAR